MKLDFQTIGLCLLILMGSSTIFFVSGWNDSDTYRFYNRACYHNDQFDTPILSKTIFNALGCNILLWKITEFILMLIILFTLFLCLTKYDFEPKIIYLTFLCAYFVYFYLSFEDDHLAFPLLTFGFFALQKNKKWPTNILFLLLTIFLGLFVWKGAFLIGGIIFLWSLKPVIGLCGTLIYLEYFGLNNWGGSTEAIIGKSLLVNMPILFIIFLFIIFRKFDWKKELNQNFALLTSFMILVFFQPKWGTYLILPILLILGCLKKEFFETKTFRLLVILSLCYFLFVSIWATVNQQPSFEQRKLLEEAVRIQKEGNIVLNDWSLGAYITFLGGKPSMSGGYTGPQGSDKNYFWIGKNNINCETIQTKDSLFLQKCGEIIQQP